MLFPTVEFFVFFVILFLLYWYIITKPRDRKVLLTIASFVFYAFFSLPFAALMVVFSLVIWLGGRLLQKIKSYNARKTVFILFTIFNVLYLLYFKEAYNLFQWLDGKSIFSPELMHHLLQAAAVVPLGVSYYVFKSCSYIFDVYLGSTMARKSPVDIILYLTFFPQVFSGPIVNATYFFDHLEASLNADKESYNFLEFDRAVLLILLGLVKKMIVATFLAVLLVNPAFANPLDCHAIELVFAACAYSVVIYADFSGYSDMSIGIALLLGFQTPANFNRPYAASNITNFWRRWHISFSSWLRDYVYFACGGSRFGIVRTCFALMVTIIVAGLWHGFKWTFLIWGLMHGTALIVERLIKHFREKKLLESQQDIDTHQGIHTTDEGDHVIDMTSFSQAQPTLQAETKQASSYKKFSLFLSAARTFLFVTLSWIFFRSETLGEVGLFFKGLLNWTTGFKLVSPVCILIIIAVLACQAIPQAATNKAYSLYVRLPFVVKAALVYFAVICIYLVIPSGVPEFIYFRF